MDRKPFIKILTALLAWLCLVFPGTQLLGAGETAAPPMACNDLVNLSLDTNCIAVLTPDMVLEDMTGVVTDYSIVVYGQDGKPRSSDSFGIDDVRYFFDYKIWHLPTGNSCWGKVFVEDKYPPQLVCDNDTVRCGDTITPQFLGFPIPAWLSPNIIQIGTHSFLVSGWDQCGLTNLSYSDLEVKYSCDSACLRIVIRSWTAVDPWGNTARCKDTICVLKPTAADIAYPHHYDGYDRPALPCDTLFPKLPDGNPHPDFTGWPVPSGCTTLTASFSDLRIPICGNTYKILRRWIILDWCSGEINEFPQIIKILDEKAPVFKCPADFTMGMKPYTCLSEGKLPAPDSVVDCNQWSYDVFTKVENPIPGQPDIVSKQYIEYDKNTKCFYLRGAPPGRIWIEYHVEDVCGNLDTCTMEVGVVDDLAPIPVCDQKTVVALGIDGTAKAFAETFDDGSIDNCVIKEFRVRRMDDPCNSGTDHFGPFVWFCCEDVGNTVMVALEVTDQHNNRNTCMVEVTVQDKEAPVVIPPTDITIHCDFPIDFAKLSIFGNMVRRQEDRKEIIVPDPFYAHLNYVAGLDGWVYDNCEVTLVETHITNILCNRGTIKRIFEATDREGLITVDTQTITLVNAKPFTKNDIIWPKDITIYSCNNVQTHPDETGYPSYKNTTCAQVAANYDDLKLAVLDSTCFKILRKWTVIDWCTYDRQTGAGIWDSLQIIAVKSSEPPTIDSCQDVDFCDPLSFYDPVNKICLGTFSLTGYGHDDCTDPVNLIWSYRLDKFNDGTFEDVQSGNQVSGVWPLGTHKLRWYLRDQCGNSSSCDQEFTIRDCKKPTPYCVNGIVTVVMQTNGSVTVWAKDFNIGSNDNCTRPERLKFSFSPDTNHTNITYNCDSLDRQRVVTKLVRIYVTDEYGNQDYCETSIRIQDNNGVCPGSSPGFQLSGKVRRENTDALPGTQVQLIDAATGVERDRQSTDGQGSYAFAGVTPGDFYLQASRPDDITNGVSTIDIVLLQRHILGLKELPSAYRILAADVNGSGNLTAKDVSDMRRAILGVIREWPNQVPTWRMLDAARPFSDPAQPWVTDERIESDELSDILDQVHFTGVKTGDVDESADVGLWNVNKRSLASFVLKLDVDLQRDGSVYVHASSATDAEIDGIQLGLSSAPYGMQWEGLFPARISPDEDEFRISGQSLRLSWASEHPMNVQSGDRLFTLVLRNAPANHRSQGLISLLEGFSSEVYVDEKAQAVMLEWIDKAGGQQPMTSVYFHPNPFSDQAVLQFDLPEAGDVTFKLYDLAGKQIYVHQLTGVQGNNEMAISARELQDARGIMYYVLSGPHGIASERIVRIDKE
ncbi:MAG: hypothetical protein IT266_00635 [Saprospiraceae bacterium]|nr:hypothetical protein [Saprospiraceae bacterium]